MANSLYINNQWISGNGTQLVSYNPATGTPVWEGTTANAEDVNLAVESARAAFPSWSETRIKTRIKFLRKFQTILENNKFEFAETISLENGKPIWDAANEVNSILTKVDISIDAYEMRCLHLVKDEKGKHTVLRHRPHGVIGVFGPFNFPAHLPNGHFIPALLAGNTIVFKPSDLTPLVAEKMIRFWKEAGLPAGVINLLQGGVATGQALANHHNLDGIFFTGSWAVGKHLTELYSQRSGKILALEMGGNNPLIFTEVDNLKAAAYTTIQSAYLTSGQRCTCARRLIIPEGSKGDAFINELLSLTKNIKIGPYTDSPQPFMGPLISPNAAKKLLETQDKLIEQGGRPLMKMSALKQGSAFLSPGLIDVTAVKNRNDEEHFGPFLQLIRVKDFQAALQEANQTEYGLTAGLLSRHKDEFNQFCASIKAGIIAWNSPTTNVASSLPFGGVGKSGNFRPTALYAADYCAYPVTYIENSSLELPETLLPGILPIGDSS